MLSKRNVDLFIKKLPCCDIFYEKDKNGRIIGGYPKDNKALVKDFYYYRHGRCHQTLAVYDLYSNLLAVEYENTKIIYAQDEKKANYPIIEIFYYVDRISKKKKSVKGIISKDRGGNVIDIAELEDKILGCVVDDVVNLEVYFINDIELFCFFNKKGQTEKIRILDPLNGFLLLKPEKGMLLSSNEIIYVSANGQEYMVQQNESFAVFYVFDKTLKNISYCANIEKIRDWKKKQNNLIDQCRVN